MTTDIVETLFAEMQPAHDEINRLLSDAAPKDRLPLAAMVAANAMGTLCAIMQQSDEKMAKQDLRDLVPQAAEAVSSIYLKMTTQ